jgi:hypothetical protein
MLTKAIYGKEDKRIRIKYNKLTRIYNLVSFVLSREETQDGALMHCIKKHHVAEIHLG